MIEIAIMNITETDSDITRSYNDGTKGYVV